MLAKRTVALQFAGILLSQMLDYSTTVLGMRLGAVESNPVMSTVIANYGSEGFLTVKLGVGFLLACFSARRPNVAWLTTLLFTGAALWNLSQITRLIA